MAVLTALRVAPLVGTPDGLPVGEVWGDTTIELPAGPWRNALTGTTLDSTNVAHIFATMPVALLVSSTTAG